MSKSKFDLFLTTLAVCCAAAALVFWLSTLNQPLIDLFDFRQTQTGLTALYFEPSTKGFFHYQTPVVGAPWSIPFELPLYQWLTFHLSEKTPLGLTTSGRLISTLFGIGCIIPSARLLKRYDFKPSSIKFFIALYCTSSIYLYWNRTFLIESTALFFTLMSLDSYTDLDISIQAEHGWPRRKLPQLILFPIFLALALTIKATTALPTFLILGLHWLLRTVKSLPKNEVKLSYLTIGLCLLFSIVCLFLWTNHSDSVKELNPIGKELTSSALRQWNFGKFAQRFSEPLWLDVVVRRMLSPVGAIPAIIIVTAGFFVAKTAQRCFILACTALAIAPLLIFTNLHLVHTYYQAGNQIFLLLAISSAASTIIEKHTSQPYYPISIICLITIYIMGSINIFTSTYLPASLQQEKAKLTIGSIIKENTPSDSAIIVLGDGWSSAIPFHSNRKAFARPDFLDNKLKTIDILDNIETLLGGLQLGAIASRESIGTALIEENCPSSKYLRIRKWHLYLCNQETSRRKPAGLTN